MATAYAATGSLVEAVSDAKPGCSTLTPRRGNGSQHAGKRFRKAMPLPGIHTRSVRTRTPEQNGHMDRFHGTPKR